jgi:hypothetical protein
MGLLSSSWNITLVGRLGNPSGILESRRRQALLLEVLLTRNDVRGAKLDCSSQAQQRLHQYVVNMYHFHLLGMKAMQ